MSPTRRLQASINIFAPFLHLYSFQQNSRVRKYFSHRTPALERRIKEDKHQRIVSKVTEYEESTEEDSQDDGGAVGELLDDLPIDFNDQDFDHEYFSNKKATTTSNNILKFNKMTRQEYLQNIAKVQQPTTT